MPLCSRVNQFKGQLPQTHQPKFLTTHSTLIELRRSEKFLLTSSNGAVMQRLKTENAPENQVPGLDST
jgi:hypothetical protein